jgi:hypothetical protein
MTKHPDGPKALAAWERDVLDNLVANDPSHSALTSAEQQALAHALALIDALTALVAVRRPGKSVFPEVVALRDKLATANVLLERVRASSRGRRWVKAIDAHLAGQPAAPPRAERKPYENCTCPSVHSVGSPFCPAQNRIAAVERARQFAAPDLSRWFDPEPANPVCVFCGCGHEVCSCL